MLTRRHIRVKVMQCIYAITLSKDGSLEQQQKFLNQSIAQTYTLYILILALLKELQHLASQHAEQASRKYIKTPSESQVSPLRLSDNRVLLQLAENTKLTKAIDQRGLKQWYLNEKYVKILLGDILGSELYRAYAEKPSTYENDREFLIRAYREIIAPNDKIYEFLEDEGITWVDDLPLINTYLLKQFRKVKPNTPESFFLPALLKNKEDMDFAVDLLKKALLKAEELEGEMEGKTPNWDKERIAELDGILLKMAIAELLYFPSIPERVTINEYLEIAKEYSTPKSSVFINGVLDKLIKEYKASGRLKKTGRGLL
jgi:N utilization substance protein B